MRPVQWGAVLLGSVAVCLLMIVAAAAGQSSQKEKTWGRTQMAICLLNTPDDQELTCFPDLDIPK